MSSQLHVRLQVAMNQIGRQPHSDARWKSQALFQEEAPTLLDHKMDRKQFRYMELQSGS